MVTHDYSNVRLYATVDIFHLRILGFTLSVSFLLVSCSGHNDTNWLHLRMGGSSVSKQRYYYFYYYDDDHHLLIVTQYLPKLMLPDIIGFIDLKKYISGSKHLYLFYS